MIPDVEERLHIERYIGSSLIAKSQQHQQHGGGYAHKQAQPNYVNNKQFQNTRYPKFGHDSPKNNPDNRPVEHASSPTPNGHQRYPFAPKTITGGVYSRNTDARTNCWSGYPLITFNSDRRDNQNGIAAEQPRHYYATTNVGGNLKTYPSNAKPSKCSYSDFVTNKQGVPLIQANGGKFQDKSNWERENRNFHTKNGLLNEPSSPYCPGSKSSIADGRENHGKNDCTDENYGNSENCLPRIIKPRKRRKKDRKPSTAGFTSPSNAPPQTVKKLQEKSSDKSVYKLHSDKAPDSSQILHNLHLTLYRPKSKPLALYQDSGGCNVNDLLISRSLVNLFSEDSPQLLLTDDLRFDNFLSKDSSSDSSQSTTTFCNCRYCDPEGVVWDIRQRCFSPNLMPPGEGAQNVGVVFGKLAKNKDWSTTLKRSCSEPVSKPSSTPVVPRVRALSDSYDTTNQNLQVSSEIVTSLNGHRDIEIKFFSSTTPTSKI